MIRALLFDSDGVLVDTERLFFDATAASFRAAGVEVSPPQWARWYLGEGKRSPEIAQLVGMAPSLVEGALAMRDRWFWARIAEGAPVCPGVVETLKCLARQFRLAVVTGGSRAHFDRAHAYTGLRDFFEVIVTGDECDHVKPHPQAYLMALERLALGPDECLAIEDSPRGARAAVAAGIRCVVIPTSLTDTSLCPDTCALLEGMASLAQFLGIEKSVVS